MFCSIVWSCRAVVLSVLCGIYPPSVCDHPHHQHKYLWGLQDTWTVLPSLLRLLEPWLELWETRCPDSTLRLEMESMALASVPIAKSASWSSWFFFHSHSLSSDLIVCLLLSRFTDLTLASAYPTYPSACRPSSPCTRSLHQGPLQGTCALTAPPVPSLRSHPPLLPFIY